MQMLEVQTQAGAVRGTHGDGVARFLGIPYAAAPVGALRFAKPQAPARWSGARDATASPPNSPQIIRDFPELDIAPLIGTGWVRGDEFLNVNVWTPSPIGAGLPVLVFIHGGAFTVGSNDAPVIDGSAFARSGVVYMAINYRLGVEGFLPIEGAPTNLGLRDQLAALAWVRDNAPAFGGDPANVTVFGESAGAMSIADLVGSPLAKGLFRRAIIQSGHGSMVRPLAIAQRLTRKLAKMLKIRPDLEGFRSTSFEACAQAVAQVQLPTTRIDLRGADGFEPAFGLSRFLPVIGDDVLPEHPLEALAGGAGAEVELLIGTNAEEMNLYFVPTGVKAKLGRLLAWFALGRVYPKARAALKAYGMGQPGRGTGVAFTEALHDLVFRLPARQFAARHRGRTHFYEFGWRSPAFGGELGACHAIEIPFVFNTLDCCSGPRGFVGVAPPQALAERVHGLWVEFARSGSLPWPEYEAGARTVYSLDTGSARRDPDMPAERL